MKQEANKTRSGRARLLLRMTFVSFGILLAALFAHALLGANLDSFHGTMIGLAVVLGVASVATLVSRKKKAARSTAWREQPSSSPSVE
jgi:hypothetical protein